MRSRNTIACRFCPAFPGLMCLRTSASLISGRMRSWRRVAVVHIGKKQCLRLSATNGVNLYQIYQFEVAGTGTSSRCSHFWVGALVSDATSVNDTPVSAW